MARRYRSSRRQSYRALGLLLAAALGSTLVLAYLWSFLGDLGEMAFLGPVARALVIGWVLAFTCRRYYLSNARIAATIAGLSTLVCIAGSYAIEFRHERSQQIQAAQELAEQRRAFGVAESEVQAHYEESVAGLTLGNHARLAFGLRGPGRDRASNLLGPAFGISLLTLELIVAVLVSMYLPAGQASEPVCASCGLWLREEHLASSRFGKSDELIAALLAGDGADALDALEPPDTKESLELKLASCPLGHPQAGGVLRLYEHYYARSSRDLRTRHRADLILDFGEGALLQAAVSRLG